MIYVFLLFLIVIAGLITIETKIIRLIVYLSIFSLISSVCFLFLGAPDVAMAEAVVSAFSTIIFIVCFEKYYSFAEIPAKAKMPAWAKRNLAPLIFTALLAGLFIWFIPSGVPSSYLKEQYLSFFARDVGGENAVTAIYLGYRMYDTLFEALMLLVSIVAVVHLSWYDETHSADGEHSDIKASDIAGVTIRIICPVLLVFSIYLIMNGYISPGGGFQGGVVIASFFICRYMVHDIYDVRADKVITLEKLIYVGIVFITGYFIMIGAQSYLPIPKSIYLIIMNLLVGIKVACGFFVVFYRFIAFERR